MIKTTPEEQRLLNELRAKSGISSRNGKHLGLRMKSIGFKITIEDLNIILISKTSKFAFWISKSHR